MRFRLASFAATLVTLVLAAPQLPAQELRGAIVLVNSRTVVAGVIIEARSAAEGTVIARAVTNDRGEFLLRLPAAGTYAIRGLRIGSRPATFGLVTVAAGERQMVRWELAPMPLMLADVRVVGRQVCGRRAMGVEEVATMLDEARKALQLSQLGAANNTSAEWTIDHQMADLEGEPAGPITTEIHRGLTRKPFASLPVDSLAKVGYAVADSGGSTFYAPDADVLLSDLFVDSHCFRTVPSRGVDRAWIGLAFEPIIARRDERVLISGTIWLDRASAELRRLDYRYANVSRRMSAAAAGGQVTFRRVADDFWIVSRWVIRMPSPVGLDGSVQVRLERNGRSSGSMARSLQTITGAVMRVQSDSAVLYAVADSTRPPIATASTVAALCPGGLKPDLGVLWGVLRDSLGNPLGGATVDVEWDVAHRWFGESRREWDSRGRTAMTSALGIWIACDIPRGTALTAWGQQGAVSGVPALLEVPRDSQGLEVQLTIGQPRRGGRRLLGVVVDSLRFSGPVPEADVRVLGTSVRTFADTAGGFEFDSLPVGPITVVWRDVMFDLLGINSPSRTLAVGENEIFELASPSVATFARRVCGVAVAEGTGVIVGQVVNLVGEPRKGVAVRATWTRLRIASRENRTDSVVVVDTTDVDGRYALCGVPRASSAEVRDGSQELVDGEFTLSASGGPLVAGPISVKMDGAGVMRRDIVVGPGRRARVRGRVVDVTGAPLVGAMVSLNGNVELDPARSGANGEWALDSVPLSSAEIVVRSIGFLPARVAIDPVNGAHEAVDVRIERIPQELEASLIVGQRRASLLEAFESRRRTGLGTFLDEQTTSSMLLSIAILNSYVRRSEMAGSGLQRRILFETTSIMGGALCNPLWYVDGIRYGVLSGPEQASLLAQAKMVEAYRGYDAPAEFLDSKGCGTIVIWTRVD